MTTNHTPHFHSSQYRDLRSGGSLKDGWSYLVPADEFVLNAEVSVAFADELEDHVKEQANALRALYLSSSSNQDKPKTNVSTGLEIEEEEVEKKDQVQFIMKRGLQVVGVATYSDRTGHLFDVAIRPSAAEDCIGETLMDAVKKHARKLGRSESLIVHPRSPDSMPFFRSLGFLELEEEDTMMASIH